MSKISKKDIQKTVNSNEPIDYEKLRLDVLKGLIEIRNIECKQTKEEMVKYLKMEDQGKYFRPVTYQKQPDGKFIVGIDNLNSYYSKNLKIKRLNILQKCKNFQFKKIDLSDLNKFLYLFINKEYNLNIVFSFFSFKIIFQDSFLKGIT